MNIQWSITKERGNLRPILHYTIALTEFEKSIGMPAVRIQSTIPKPPDAGWTHCWPGENERGDWSPSDYYLLMSPSHKVAKTEEVLKLPWRKDNAYPEVEESFDALRKAFEEALVNASNSEPMNLAGRMETSGLAKRIVAPAFAAERILQFARR